MISLLPLPKMIFCAFTQHEAPEHKLNLIHWIHICLYLYVKSSLSLKMFKAENFLSWSVIIIIIIICQTLFYLWVSFWTKHHLDTWIFISVNELVFIKNRCFTCMINVSSIFTWVENKMLSGLYMFSVLCFSCYYSETAHKQHLAFLSLLPVSDSAVKLWIIFRYVRSYVVIPKSHPETHFCPSGISD